MKNLPETNFWNRIKARLENYEEVPADDAWDKIAGAMPPIPSRSNKGKKAIGVAAIFLAGTFAGIGIDHYLMHNEPSSKKSELSHDDESTDVLNDGGHKKNPALKSEEPINTAENDESASIQNDVQHQAKHSVVDNDDNGSAQRRRAVASRSSAADDNGVRTTRSSKEINGVDSQEIKSRTIDRTTTTVNPDVTIVPITAKPTNVPMDGQQRAEQLDATVREIHAEPSSQTNSAMVSNSPVTINTGLQPTTRSEEIKIMDEPAIDPDIDDNGKNATGNRNVRKSEAAVVKLDDQHGDDQSPVDSIRREKKLQNEVNVNSKKSNDLRKPRILKGANLYVIVTPSLSFQEITPSTNDDVEVIDFESPGVMAKERLGWSLDAGYQGLIRKHLEWYAGLSYYQQQQTLTYRYKTGEFELISTGKGHAMIPKIDTRSFSYNMRNVGVSAGLFYTIKHGGLQHKFGAGLLFQKGLLKSDEEQSYNNTSATYFNYQLSYRLEMAIKPRWNVFLQPTFIHSIYSNEGLKEPFELKPYRAGIGLGVIYRF